MQPNSFEPSQAPANDPLALGIPAGLVFDGEPLEPLLSGAEPVAPTPANVVERWEQGFDHSAACARALAAVLVQNPEAISNFTDLDGAEHCLRAALDSNPRREGAPLAAWFTGLGRVLELKQQTGEAESHYRQALELQEKTLGAGHEATFITGMRLVQLLEQTDRKEEADRLRNQFEGRRMTGKVDSPSLWHLRSVARDRLLAGQYAEAEALYRQLVEKRFELGSTHCHLARLFLMTDRDDEARRAADRAWAVRDQSPAYVIVRIHFFKTLQQMLAGGNWEECLKAVKSALDQPGAHMDWTIQPVLEHLKGRMQNAECGIQNWELLTTLAAAISNNSKIAELQSNPLWKAVCCSTEPELDTKTSATTDIVASPVSESHRAEANSTPPPTDQDRFTFGTIIEANEDCILLKEYDFAKDSDVENEYRVNAETEFANVSKATDLVAGDAVVVDYIESNGQHFILTLAKEDSDETRGTIAETE